MMEELSRVDRSAPAVPSHAIDRTTAAIERELYAVARRRRGYQPFISRVRFDQDYDAAADRRLFSMVVVFSDGCHVRVDLEAAAFALCAAQERQLEQGVRDCWLRLINSHGRRRPPRQRRGRQERETESRALNWLLYEPVLLPGVVTFIGCDTGSAGDYVAYGGGRRMGRTWAFEQLAATPLDLTATEVEQATRDHLDREMTRTMFLGAGGRLNATTATAVGSDAPSLTVATIRQAMRELEVRRQNFYQDCDVFGRAVIELLGAEVGDSNAQGKAEALLRAWLSPPQLAQYDADGHFEVTGSATGRRFRIRKASSYNIDALDDEGYVSATYCVVPEGRLALGDVMLAQKIALETDEQATLAVANKRLDKPEGLMPWCVLDAREVLRRYGQP